MLSVELQDLYFAIRLCAESGALASLRWLARVAALSAPCQIIAGKGKKRQIDASRIAYGSKFGAKIRIFQ